MSSRPNLGVAGAGGSFGYPSAIYKVVDRADSQIYALRRWGILDLNHCMYGRYSELLPCAYCTALTGLTVCATALQPL